MDLKILDQIAEAYIENIWNTEGCKAATYDGYEYIPDNQEECVKEVIKAVNEMKPRKQFRAKCHPYSDGIGNTKLKAFLIFSLVDHSDTKRYISKLNADKNGKRETRLFSYGGK